MAGKHYLKADIGGGSTKTVEAEFPPNNSKSRETEKPKVKKIANATRKKKTLGMKIKESIVGNDSRSVGEYIFQDVLIPAAKDTITAMVSGGIEMMMYGEVRGRREKSKNGSKASYYKYYEKDSTRERDRGYANRSSYSFTDIEFETRGEAEEVLNCLADLIDTYGVATVADFYDAVGIASEYTDNKYGWTSLRNAGSKRIRDGFILELPKPKVVD